MVRGMLTFGGPFVQMSAICRGCGPGRIRPRLWFEVRGRSRRVDGTPLSGPLAMRAVVGCTSPPRLANSAGLSMARALWGRSLLYSTRQSSDKDFGFEHRTELATVQQLVP